MLVRLFTFFAILGATLIGCSQKTLAQTVRVNIGTDNSGTTRYMDVYEYDCVTEKPSFPGGEAKLTEFINANREYPQDAYKQSIQGKVTCWFIVNTDGTVSNVNLLKSVWRSLDLEAMRIFSIMPAWIPGKINGISVPVRVVRTVRFRK